MVPLNEVSGVNFTPCITNLDSSIAVRGQHGSIAVLNKDVVVCFDSSLEPVWTLSLGDAESNLLTEVYCEDSNIFVCGSTKNKTTRKYDTLVACFTENGELKWCTTIGGKSNEEAYGIG